MAARTATMRRRAPAAAAVICLAAIAAAGGCDRGPDTRLELPSAPGGPSTLSGGGCAGDYNGPPGPVVFFLPEAFSLSSPTDCACPPPAINADGDTVCAFSTVTFVWSGVDTTAEIACWEYKLNIDPWVSRGRSDTTFTFHAMPPGRHTLSVRAINRRGNITRNLARFRINSNFAPVTVVDRDRVMAYQASSSTGPLQGVHVAGVQDTIPYGSRVSFAWSSSDCDGSVVSYIWRYGLESGQTTARSATTGPILLSSRDGTRGYPMLVQGVDNHGFKENGPDSVWIHANLRPWARLLDGEPLQVPVGTPYEFWFEGGDRDSDPAALTYSWNFSFTFPTTPATYPPDSMFVRQTFTPSTIGTHHLILQSFDQSGLVRPSDPDTLLFDVVP